MPDTEGILEGCAFIKDAISRPLELDLKQSQLVVDVLAHAAGSSTHESRALVYEKLEAVPNLAASKIQSMIERANEYGTRSCASMHVMCGDKSKCLECPNWGKVSHPIKIKSNNYIATEATGFHHIVTSKNGGATYLPDYEGLRRAFYREAPYKTIVDSGSVFNWTGTHWKEVFTPEMTGFAQDKFRPLAKTQMVNEFANLVGRTERDRHSFFSETTEMKMNFENGVLDLKTDTFMRHSTDIGFRHVLPYNYDPEAQCPQFMKFLGEITLFREELMEMILQFAGYSLSSDKCWEHKALILQGEGRNGKSKLVSVIKALAGEGNSTALTLVDLEKDTNRYALDGSLFNIAEETPSKSLTDSFLFKNLVSGGETSVKQLYKQPYTIRNRSKFWLLCNEMPRTFDKSYAMFRRLEIVPFEATFTGEKEDKHIEDKLFTELPGIFNVVIAAYKRMKAGKRLIESAISKQLVEGYKIENDNVARWFIDNCVDIGNHKDVFLEPQHLYNSYRNFVEREGEKPCTGPSFYRRLSNVWPSYSERREKRRVEGSYPKTVITGIRLVDPHSHKR